MATLTDRFEAANLDQETEETEHMEGELNYDDLTERYNDFMQKVEDLLEKGLEFPKQAIVLEDDREEKFIVDCNDLFVDIEKEVFRIYDFIRDKYRLKFPELETLVHHPFVYVRAVKKIGNEMVLTRVDLTRLLSSPVIKAVSVALSTTNGKQLPEDVLKKTIDACDMALDLHAAMRKVHDLMGSRMEYIAPNLSAIVGSSIASKLVGAAGGLSALAKMPACNVQLIGTTERNFTPASKFRAGYIMRTELSQKTPPSLRERACRLLAEKSTLAARLDSTRGDPTGNTGTTILNEIYKKIEKWKEPVPA